MESFNQYLLAKQAWRIIQSPNSLAATVLKELYFSRGSFHDVVAKPSASFIWHSILWGCQLLDKGIRWRVGNGNNISVNFDKWIPRSSSFKIMVPPSLPSSLSGCDLISASGGWNSIFIKSNFSCIDAEAILALPYPSAIVSDRLI
ncbi:hypothetical protein ACOSQ3_002322 [Xanthoceras sorbifolium]